MELRRQWLSSVCTSVFVPRIVYLVCREAKFSDREGEDIAQRQLAVTSKLHKHHEHTNHP